MRRKALFFFLLLPPLFLGVSLLWRMRPTFTDKETYNDFFPKRRFIQKVSSPVPNWMQEQIESDFKEIQPVTAEKLEAGYDILLQKIKEPLFLHHYRILDNQLYKYVPPTATLSCRDSFYEKSLKTLLSHTKLPDLDFIICPMDGIPEPIVPADFFLFEKAEDQIPLLGQAKLKEPLTRYIVLIPDQLTLSKDWYDTAQEILALNQEIPWSEKIGKAFWRGGTSDHVCPSRKILFPHLPSRISLDAIHPTPRFIMCQIAARFPDWVDAASTYCPAMMPLVEKEGLAVLKDHLSKRDHLRYKYQPTLDGMMCTYPGYQWRLLSNSLTLKQESPQVQWFYQALVPYQHYLPIASDLSDLVDKLKWAEEHEEEVLRMIQNAQDFAANHLLYEDVYRYLYLVLQKYATLQEIDFSDLKRKTKKDPRWVNIHYRRRLGVSKSIQRWKNRWKLQAETISY